MNNFIVKRPTWRKHKFLSFRLQAQNTKKKIKNSPGKNSFFLIELRDVPKQKKKINKKKFFF